MLSHPRSLLLLALGVLSGCSAGSNTSVNGGSATGNLDLFVNTGTGSDVHISGRLSVVALEAASGALTSDLLAGDPEITLSDPVPELTGPRLVDAPPDTYVAAHLAFASQELTGTFPDGTQAVITLPQRDFRLPLSRPLVLAAGPQSWFTLHHDGPIELVASGNGYSWSPAWVAQAAEVELLRAARVQATSFDTARYVIDGKLLAMNELPVVLNLARADVLRRDGDVVTRDAFFAALRVGDLMTIDGWLDQYRNVLVIAAAIDSDGGEGREQKSEVRGEIVELSPASERFVLNVLSIRKDRAGLPSTRPLHLDVAVDERTRIKWLPRHGRHRGHLAFEDLRTGMLVDVEWHGPAPDLRLTAKKVDVRAQARGDVPRVVTGAVDSVDVAAGSFVLGRRGRATFRLGDARYDTLVVEVDADSYLLRRAGDRAERIELNQVTPGSRVFLLFERIGGNRIRALLAFVAD